MPTLQSTLRQSKRLCTGVLAAPQYLTGSDIFNGHIGIPVVLVYPQGLDLARMEQALLEALRVYPIIAGRMKRDPQGHVYVDCNDAGIDWRVHDCAGPLPAHGPDSKFGDTIKRYYKPFWPWQLINKDTPLLKVHVYRFACGGVVLSSYGPHSLFDGASYWQFMLDWSLASRGLPIKPPCFDRQTVINAGLVSTPPDDTNSLIYDPSMAERMGLFARLGWRALTSLRKEVFRIPASTIQQWKDEAKQSASTDAGVSTVELVTAYCMKLFSPLMNTTRERSVGIVLDLRHKRRLKIPRDYFGNALGYGEARYTHQALMQDSLASLARRCRPASEQVSTEALFQLLAQMETYRQRRGVWRLFMRPAGETLHAGLILNNCVHFPIYDIDFGQGPPAWYDICAVAFRMLMVVPTPQQDGGVDLHLTAKPAELRALSTALKQS